MRVRNFILSFSFLTASSLSFGQAITVENTLTPEELVEDILVGTGVVISNVEFNYSVPLAESVQTMMGYFDGTGTTWGIGEGVIIATGNVALAEGTADGNEAGGATDNTGVAPDPNDLDLDAIGTTTINDEAVLEFDFVPDGDSIIFNYIFASEEYNEFVGSSFNDVFGFFISGPGFAGPYTDGAENIALVPGTTTPVAINNVNNGDAGTGPCTNCAFWVNNPPVAGPIEPVEYDAHTSVLQAKAEVQCGETYHIKICIGDAGDMAWDSAVFLEASSFSSNGISVEVTSAIGDDAIIEGCDSALVQFIRPSEADTTSITIDYDIGGTAINGTDYPFLDSEIDMPIGEDTVGFWITPFDDGSGEGTETITITVGFLNACGDSVFTTATIEIIDPEPFDLITTDTTITCPQDSVLIAVGFTGGVGPYDFTWDPGSGSGTEIWVPGDVAGTVTYSIDAVDQCGETAAGTIDVTIDPAPTPEIVFNEDLFTICPTSAADIESTVIDPYSTPVTYTWSPTGETTPDISVSPTTDTWYVLTIDDGCFTISDSTLVEIGDVTIDAIDIVNATDCPGAAGASLGSLSVSPDLPTWEYQLIGVTPVVPSGIFTDLPGGVWYTLQVWDDNGCTTDTLVYVGLDANEVSATLDPSSLGDVTCFGDGDGTATVINITDGLMPPFDVLWTDGTTSYDETGVPDLGSASVNSLDGGAWTVIVTDQFGCSWSETFEIEEPEEMILDFTFNEPLCYGFSDGSVTANVEGGNGDYTFNITNEAGTTINIGNSNTANNLGIGWYYTTIVDSKGCEVSGAVYLTQPEQLDIDLDLFQPLCYDEPTGLAEVDTVFNHQYGYENISYFWTPNTTGIPGGIGVTVQNKMGPGDYTITINDGPCSMVYDFSIEYPDELVFSEIGYEPAYCRQYGYQSGTGQVYAAAVGGTPDYTYYWVHEETGDTTYNTTWGGLDPGTYQIYVTDDHGCILTQELVLDSLNPIADFSVASAELDLNLSGTAIVCAEFRNESINFANPLNPLADTSGWWSFDYPNQPWVLYEGTEGFYEVYDTCYDTGGEYDVCLKIQNKNGCEDSICKTITVYNPLEITPPNIFTPDGDGINDEFTFEFLAKGVSEIQIIIVNRWGVKMAELNGLVQGWDGTDRNGSTCRDGVYFYTYEGTAENGDPFAGQGTIQLVGAK